MADPNDPRIPALRDGMFSGWFVTDTTVENRRRFAVLTKLDEIDAKDPLRTAVRAVLAEHEQYREPSGDVICGICWSYTGDIEGDDGRPGVDHAQAWPCTTYTLLTAALHEAVTPDEQ